MTANFHLAPPPKTVDGLAAVPIDIQTIDAVFIFDGAASAASADATITYTVGPTAGNPIFDLRQEIADDAVVFLRLFEVDGMAGVRDHRERR